MNFKYKLFAKIFNFYKLFSFKKIFITFIIDETSSNYSLRSLKKELDNKVDFKYNYIYKENYSFNNTKKAKGKLLQFFSLLNFFFIETFRLARSKYIFLNDNFFPLAYMDFDEDTTIMQLWHAPGAFKRFGMPVISDENIKKLIKESGLKTDYVVVTSKNVSKIYAEAFAVDEKKILPTSIPKMDFYFNKNYQTEENIDKIKSKLEERYSDINNDIDFQENQAKNIKNNLKIKEMKIILYAPTFRENIEFNNDIPNYFDFDLFNKELGMNYYFLFKSHPKYPIKTSKYIIDVSDYENIEELLLIADILITDYSSLMVEYSVLSKPIIFYPFDLDYYNSNERGFYFNYKDVPGPIAKNTKDIINIIKDNDYDYKKIEDFAEYSFDYFDDNSSKRIVDYIIKKN